MSLGDQAVASASNFLLAVLVAQDASVSEFGVFGLLMSVYWLAAGTGRALLGEPLLILHVQLHESFPAARQHAVSCAIALGALLGSLLAFIALFVGSTPTLVLAVFLPALLAQDTLRYAAFAWNRGVAALVSDAAWLAFLAIAGFGLVSAGETGLTQWLLVWGAGATLGAVAAGLVSRVWPAVRGANLWLRRVRVMALQLWGDFLLGSGGQQLVIFVLPLVAGLEVVGGLKAAQVAFGPFAVALTAVNLVAIPAVARMHSAGDDLNALRQGGRLAAVLFASGLVYAAALVAMPESVGQQVFGEAWVQGSQVAPFVGLQTSFIAIAYASNVVMRGTGNTGAGLRVRVVFTPIGVAIPIVGAAVGGLTGLGVGLVASAVIGGVLWWGATRRVILGGRGQLPN